MLNFRSVTDLNALVVGNLHRVPPDVDLIVGIPRSGMLFASLLALHSNRQFCDIEAFLRNDPLVHGSTREVRFSSLQFSQDAEHVLVVDDSVASGASLRFAMDRVHAAVPQMKVSSACAYVEKKMKRVVDIAFEELSQPRLFEWNLFHREFLGQCQLDIDGVLCQDPTLRQNDDGSAYRRFLLEAIPLSLPSIAAGELVTSRLEKWRPETEAWLDRYGVKYRVLHMLDLPDGEARRAQNCHAEFKAGVYAGSKARLFIESDPRQAAEIAERARKPVLCFGDKVLYQPGMSVAVITDEARTSMKRWVDRLRRSRQLGVRRSAKMLLQKMRP